MSKEFEKDAKSILDNAPAPDADAAVIKEVKEEKEKPKKRGRPKGSTSKKTNKTKNENNPNLEAAAKAINGCVFGVTCSFFGTAEAWPSEERAEAVDKALERYLELKDIDIPPELILAGAYSLYLAEIAKKEEVQSSIKSKLVKFNLKSIFGKIKNIFKRKEKTK